MFSILSPSSLHPQNGHCIEFLCFSLAVYVYIPKNTLSHLEYMLIK